MPEMFLKSSVDWASSERKSSSVHVICRPLSSTKLCCRISSLKTILHNYNKLLIFFGIIEKKKTDAGAKTRGFLKTLSSFKFVLITERLITIFNKLKILNISLQQRSLRWCNTSYCFVSDRGIFRTSLNAKYGFRKTNGNR